MLLHPALWKCPGQPGQRQPARFLSLEDRLDNIRGQGGQAQDAADVGGVDAQPAGEVADRGHCWAVSKIFLRLHEMTLPAPGRAARGARCQMQLVWSGRSNPLA